MAYNCKILLDSISPTGKRLTTFEITFPRIVLAEFNTHRMFSRNSASSRAIPISKMLERVAKDPFVPEKFPYNSKGMQPYDYMEQGTDQYHNARILWLDNLNEITKRIAVMQDYGIHKQICNRLLEPFMWHTVIVTATEWDNFFKLRTHPDAQYEIRRIADLMYEAYHNNYCYNNRFNQCDRVHSHPQKLKVGEWHCPLVYEEDELAILHYISQQDTENGEYQRKVQYKNFKSPEIGSLDNGSDEELYNELIEIKKKISVARCARVSYLTHDGKRNIEKDLELFERLQTSGHWSPFEHVATPYCHEGLLWQINKKIKETGEQYIFPPDINLRSGNFIGWKQYRKEFPNENCTNFRKE